MKLFLPLLVHFSFKILFITAKISGGPRGRFDNNHTRTNGHHVSSHHAHFSYHPPAYISFMCRYCSSPVSYPVYSGLPPSYVYKLRESGTRYGDLLSGLALFNLGRSANEHWYYSHFPVQRPEEQCFLQIIDQLHFEETTFPCFMMSSFVERSLQLQKADAHYLNIFSSEVDVRTYLHTAGPPLTVTRYQECVIWGNGTAYQKKYNIPCALLKEYANTMKAPGIPVYVWFPLLLASVIITSVCCQCKKWCKRKSFEKEEAPLKQGMNVGLYPNFD